MCPAVAGDWAKISKAPSTSCSSLPSIEYPRDPRRAPSRWRHTPRDESTPVACRWGPAHVGEIPRAGVDGPDSRELAHERLELSQRATLDHPIAVRRVLRDDRVAAVPVVRRLGGQPVDRLRAVVNVGQHLGVRLVVVVSRVTQDQDRGAFGVKERAYLS